MFSNFPFERVNWFTSSFLVFSFLTALIGVPIYIYHFGIDWFQIALFAFYALATGMSITLGYHRLFAHKAFKARKPVKIFTLIFGACAFEDSAMDWSSDHRKHHKHVDDYDEDPYSISRGFFYAHIGWIFFKLFPRELENVNDLKKDPLVAWQHRYAHLIGVMFGLVLPPVLGFLYGGWSAALGAFLIGGLARVVIVQHCTFFINSLCHTIGTRPYDASTSARDSWIMALLTYGEGYHNYHHSFQHDYRNGVKPWQWDPTKWAIWTLEKLGLAYDLRKVPDEKIVLAEIREMKKQAEDHVATSQSWCSTHKAAYEKLLEISKGLGESYRELESAIGDQVDVSRRKLAEWRREALSAREHLHFVESLQPTFA